MAPLGIQGLSFTSARKDIGKDIGKDNMHALGYLQVRGRRRVRAKVRLRVRLFSFTWLEG